MWDLLEWELLFQKLKNDVSRIVREDDRFEVAVAADQLLSHIDQMNDAACSANADEILLVIADGKGLHDELQHADGDLFLSLMESATQGESYGLKEKVKAKLDKEMNNLYEELDKIDGKTLVKVIGEQGKSAGFIESIIKKYKKAPEQVQQPSVIGLSKNAKGELIKDTTAMRIANNVGSKIGTLLELSRTRGIDPQLIRKINVLAKSSLNSVIVAIVKNQTPPFQEWSQFLDHIYGNGYNNIADLHADIVTSVVKTFVEQFMGKDSVLVDMYLELFAVNGFTNAWNLKIQKEMDMLDEKVSEEVKETVMQMINGAMTVEEIARFKINHSYMKRELIKLGLDVSGDYYVKRLGKTKHFLVLYEAHVFRMYVKYVLIDPSNDPQRKRLSEFIRNVKAVMNETRADSPDMLQNYPDAPKYPYYASDGNVKLDTEDILVSDPIIHPAELASPLPEPPSWVPLNRPLPALPAPEPSALSSYPALAPPSRPDFIKLEQDNTVLNENMNDRVRKILLSMDPQFAASNQRYFNAPPIAANPPSEDVKAVPAPAKKHPTVMIDNKPLQLSSGLTGSQYVLPEAPKAYRSDEKLFNVKPSEFVKKYEEEIEKTKPAERSEAEPRKKKKKKKKVDEILEKAPVAFRLEKLDDTIRRAPRVAKKASPVLPTPVEAPVEVLEIPDTFRPETPLRPQPRPNPLRAAKPQKPPAQKWIEMHLRNVQSRKQFSDLTDCELDSIKACLLCIRSCEIDRAALRDLFEETAKTISIAA